MLEALQSRPRPETPPRKQDPYADNPSVDEKGLQILALRKQIAGLDGRISLLELDKENNKEQLESLQRQLNAAVSELDGMTEDADLSFADGGSVQEISASKPANYYLSGRLETVSRGPNPELLAQTAMPESTPYEKLASREPGIANSIQSFLEISNKKLEGMGKEELQDLLFQLIDIKYNLRGKLREYGQHHTISYYLQQVETKIDLIEKQLSESPEQRLIRAKKELLEKTASNLLDILAESIRNKIFGISDNPDLKIRIKNFINNYITDEQRNRLLQLIFQAIDQAKAEKDIEYREGQSDLVRNVISKLKFLGIDPDEFKNQILNLFTRQKPVLEAQNNEGGEEEVSTVDKIKFILKKLEEIKNSGKQPTIKDVSREEMEIINSHKENYLAYRKAIDDRNKREIDGLKELGIDKIYGVIRDILEIFNFNSIIEIFEIPQTEIKKINSTRRQKEKTPMEKRKELEYIRSLSHEEKQIMENLPDLKMCFLEDNGNLLNKEVVPEKFQQNFPKTYEKISKITKAFNLEKLEALSDIVQKLIHEPEFLKLKGFITGLEIYFINKNIQKPPDTITREVSTDKTGEIVTPESTAPQQAAAFVEHKDTTETTRPSSGLFGNIKKTLASTFGAIRNLFSTPKSSVQEMTGDPSTTEVNKVETTKKMYEGSIEENYRKQLNNEEKMKARAKARKISSQKIKNRTPDSRPPADETPAKDWGIIFTNLEALVNRRFPEILFLFKDATHKEKTEQMLTNYLKNPKNLPFSQKKFLQEYLKEARYSIELKLNFQKDISDRQRKTLQKQAKILDQALVKIRA